MLMLKTRFRVGQFVVGASLVVALAGPALADNVYSWVTDDGTHAFTDDPKRIPAKHRQDVQTRPMSDLSRYDRFTRIDTEDGEPYAERLRERRNALRATEVGARTGGLVGVAASGATGMTYSVPLSGGNGGGRAGAAVQVPIGATAYAEREPTTIESIRVKPDHSMASRHWTVIKNGDEITTVIKGELNQRPLDGPDEKDFDL